MTLPTNLTNSTLLKPQRYTTNVFVLEVHISKKGSSWLSPGLKWMLIRNTASLTDFCWLRIQLLGSHTILLIFQSLGLNFLLYSINLYYFSKDWVRISINSVIDESKIYLKLKWLFRFLCVWPFSCQNFYLVWKEWIFFPHSHHYW